MLFLPNDTGSELTELFNVARVNVVEQEQERHTVNDVLLTRNQDEGLVIKVHRSSRHKCPRCRTMRREAESDRLCKRCQAVVDGLVN